MPSKIRLVIHTGPNPGKEFIVEGPATIGRGDDCSIKIDDLSISRKHCQIEVKEGVFYFKDLGSTNGIHHNENKQLAGDLAHGDRLRVGDVDFDVAEGTRPVVDRTDDYLDHRRQKKPKKKLSTAQRIRQIVITALVLGLIVLGAAGYQAYNYKRNEAPIVFELKEKPFVLQQQGFEIRPPQGEGWEYIQDFQKSSRRNWTEKPPTLGNGKILGNELFDDYHIHVWTKKFPEFGDATCFLIVEVLEGVSREKDIIGYSISRPDLPKFYSQTKHEKENPDMISGVGWAAGERGEEAYGYFKPKPEEDIRVKTFERGFVANGNRYLVMALARENFFDRAKDSILKSVDSFKAILPETESAIMTQAEILEEANKNYREGNRLFINKNDRRKLFESFMFYRKAVLMYKKLKEEPYEGRESMKNLKQVQELLEERFVALRNDAKTYAKRGAFDQCQDVCKLIMSIVTDENEEWYRWAAYSFKQFQIAEQDALRH